MISDVDGGQGGSGAAFVGVDLAGASRVSAKARQIEQGRREVSVDALGGTAFRPGISAPTPGANCPFGAASEGSSAAEALAEEVLKPLDEIRKEEQRCHAEMGPVRPRVAGEEEWADLPQAPVVTAFARRAARKPRTGEARPVTRCLAPSVGPR